MESFEDGQRESSGEDDESSNSYDSWNSDMDRQAQLYGAMAFSSPDSSAGLGRSDTETLSGLSASDTASLRSVDSGRFERSMLGASPSRHHPIDPQSPPSANSSGRSGPSPNLLEESPETESGASARHHPIAASTPKSASNLESQLASMSMSSEESVVNETDTLRAFYTLAAPAMSFAAANKMAGLMNKHWRARQYDVSKVHLNELNEEEAYSQIQHDDAILAKDIIEMAEQLGKSAFTAELRALLDNDNVS